MDLPGLIQSSDEAKDERYIKLVEGLVKEYLQSDKTVILQCFQSDEDIEVRNARGGRKRRILRALAILLRSFLYHLCIIK